MSNILMIELVDDNNNKAPSTIGAPARGDRVTTT